MAVLGLGCHMGFSLVGRGAYFLVAYSGSRACRLRLLQYIGSVIVICGLSSCGFQALGHRLISCSTGAPLLHSMCDPLGPGIEAVSPASAGGFFNTEPPGKAPLCLSCCRQLTGPLPGYELLSFSRLAWASLSSCKSLRAEIIRPLVAQALKLTWYHFCHILLVRTSCEVSPDSRDGERLYLLMGKLWDCFAVFFDSS